MKVWTVLPAHNEAENLPPLLRRLDEVFRRHGIDYGVVVVDDGSTDDTRRIVGELAATAPVHLEVHAVNQGLGVTIRDGLKATVARAGDDDVIVTMDGDNSHPPDLIPAMLRVIRAGADVVIASRYRAGSAIHGLGVDRQLISVGARHVFRWFFPIPGVRDYTCGYRAYRVAVIGDAFRRYGDAFIDQRGFQCMVDILLKLRPLNLVFREVPLVLRYDLKRGASKMRVMRTIAQSLALIARRRLGIGVAPRSTRRP
jgi:dolichol-phosphate mannosyltransferase